MQRSGAGIGAGVTLLQGVRAYHDPAVLFHPPDPICHSMSRYVLRYAGNQVRHRESGVDTAEVVARAGAKVIDDAPDMLLVECNARVGRELAHLLPGWQVNAETVTPLPRVPRPALGGGTSRARRR